MHKYGGVPSLDDLITSAEAAELLAVDRSVIIRYVQAEKLSPVRKLPGRTGSYLFSRDQVLALVPAAQP